MANFVNFYRFVIVLSSVTQHLLDTVFYIDKKTYRYFFNIQFDQSTLYEEQHSWIYFSISMIMIIDSHRGWRESGSYLHT